MDTPNACGRFGGARGARRPPGAARGRCGRAQSRAVHAISAARRTLVDTCSTSSLPSSAASCRRRVKSTSFLISCAGRFRGAASARARGGEAHARRSVVQQGRAAAHLDVAVVLDGIAQPLVAPPRPRDRASRRGAPGRRRARAQRGRAGEHLRAPRLPRRRALCVAAAGARESAPRQTTVLTRGVTTPFDTLPTVAAHGPREEAARARRVGSQGAPFHLSDLI